MRSTGEVMGIDPTFGLAFAKSQIAAGDPLPAGGTVFLSLADRDKPAGVEVARRFVELGFRHRGHGGDRRLPARARRRRGRSGGQGRRRHRTPHDRGGAWRPTPSTLIRSGKVQLVVNTPRGRGPRADGAYIRRAANVHKVACLTTVAAARAAAAGIADWADHPLAVVSLQEYHRGEQLRLPLG